MVQNKTKFVRTRFDPSQTTAMERMFALDMFPSREVRHTMAVELGLTPRNVQVWFQNRRQRLKDAHDDLHMFVTHCEDLGDDESVSSVAVILGISPESVLQRLRLLRTASE